MKRAYKAVLYGDRVELTRVTHNTEDFRCIGGLELLDPLSNQS